MRVLPVIRCPPGEAAQMIAERLEDYPDYPQRMIGNHGESDKIRLNQ